MNPSSKKLGIVNDAIIAGIEINVRYKIIAKIFYFHAQY
jgi:hypothetical protein